MSDPLVHRMRSMWWYVDRLGWNIVFGRECYLFVPFVFRFIIVVFIISNSLNLFSLLVFGVNEPLRCEAMRPNLVPMELNARRNERFQQQLQQLTSPSSAVALREKRRSNSCRSFEASSGMMSVMQAMVRPEQVKSIASKLASYETDAMKIEFRKSQEVGMNLSKALYPFSNLAFFF
jgi:hypothetical protein